jgi:hypothetical protein
VKRYVQYLLTLGLFIVFSGAQANAMSETLVISHVQAGAASGQPAAAMQELVSLYNNTNTDIDISGWCLSNISKPLQSFACVTPDSVNQKLYLTAHSYAVIASDYFSIQNGNYQADVIFPTTNNSSGSIAAGNELLTLKNAHGEVIDTVSWSTAALAPTGGYVLLRHMSTDSLTMIDSDSMNDFSKIQGITLPPSGAYEVIFDACANINDVQDAVPSGFLVDENGNCLQDVCLNLEGLQTIIPEEYKVRESGTCVFDYVGLQITELLPNASGSDDGHEFIELYNPTDRTAYLMNYSLKIGSKTYMFPAALKIEPGQYMAFYNNEMLFTLTNTTGGAILLTDDGAIVSETATYSAAEDDMAWAMIDGVWQFTNQVTFAAPNLASVIVSETEEPEAEPTLPPCAANQYRHPDTHRCRLLVTTTSVVAACKDGQYRSEETNRCRTIALAGGTLTPCGEQQYRSEETNRCRNIVTTATILNPCKDNQYRSEETNRCRTIATTNVPAAAFAIEPIADTNQTFVGWGILGGIIALALGYAVWEWRREMASMLRTIGSFFPRR